MPKIFLNDGRAVVGPEGVSDQQLDAMADLAEKGSALPKGFTVEGSAGMRDLQAQVNPTPMQQMYQAVSGPAATVRDTATQAVGQAMQGVAAMAPEAMALQDQLQQQGVPREAAAQALAQQVVPQTPDQLMSTLALGVVGPMAPAVGLAGVLARSLIPAAVGIGTNYALEREMDPTFVMSQLVGSMVGEGVGPALKLINSQLIRNKTQNAFGDKTAAAAAEIINQHSSVKLPGTPRGFEEMMRVDRGGVTAYHKLAQKTIEDAEDSLGRDLMASVAQLPPAQRQTAMFMLEDAAGMTPKLTTPSGAPPSLATPVTRVPQSTPETVLNTAIHRARKARQEMSMAKSEDKYQLAEEYKKIKDEIKTALASANPMVAQKYDAMNAQYAADLDTEFVLQQLEKRGAWSGDTTGTHFNVAEAAEALFKVNMKDSKQNEALVKLFAGESEIPGARPSTREGVMRMFMQLVTQAPSVSLGAHKKVVTVPTAPVSASHVRALQDYLATNLIHGIAENVTKPDISLERRAP